MTSDTVSAERTIPASAARIFGLISDAGRHQSFDGSGTVRGTRSETQRLQLGSRFGMSMHMGLSYSTVNTVVEYQQDRLIAWQTKGFGGLVGGRIWRYELEPAGDETLVRETWDISQDRQRFLLRRSSFPSLTRKNMARTLDRIAVVVSD